MTHHGKLGSPGGPALRVLSQGRGSSEKSHRQVAHIIRFIPISGTAPNFLHYFLDFT
jgi:hypothetical protein